MPEAAIHDITESAQTQPDAPYRKLRIQHWMTRHHCCCWQDVSGPNRAKPMTATATAQVLGIWQQYFAAAPRPEEEAAAAAADAGAGQAKEVQEVRSNPTSIAM